jgi:hypothetical protein
MNIKHAAAFALAGWYLMLPPFVMDQSGKTIVSTNPSVPLSQWKADKPFDSAAECQKYADHEPSVQAQLWRQIVQEGMPILPQVRDTWILANTQAQCIASDDPRLAK